MATTGILIVDDHAVVRDGLCQLIESDPELGVAGQVSNGEDAIRFLNATPPDLLLVDLHMAGLDGTMVIKAASRMCPDLRILALTAYTSSSYVRSALQAGAHGYVVKSESGEKILHAIHCVMKGLSYLSPDVTEEVVNGYVLGPQHFNDGPYASLTTREREIVECITIGNVRNKTLADRLFLSARTIERHKTNIFRKLGVSNTQELLDKYAERTVGKR
ncbi:response regulator transcription factor [uncultured Pseudodesulfovibrio sp.]|uniref:response regulator transcription factor n=1 Tax=uncultured Pseudodesulfovibrio sp. TaxID=2035858 RepID=UPI0029C8F35D|nr:response regulator transcription factor [uncultured Pseudodesulfovibrio sp.]